MAGMFPMCCAVLCCAVSRLHYPGHGIHLNLHGSIRQRRQRAYGGREKTEPAINQKHLFERIKIPNQVKEREGKKHLFTLSHV